MRRNRSRVGVVGRGDGYQVMCNPGKPDKCAAVKKSFGSFRGCADDFCLEGMEGYTVPDCGSGARVGRAILDRVDGGTLTLVNHKPIVCPSELPLP